MTTIRTIGIRALATAVLLAAAPSRALAHEGAGPLGMLHDALHGFLLGPGHGLRPLGLLLIVAGATGLLAASPSARPGRRPLRAAGGYVLLAGIALTLA